MKYKAGYRRVQFSKPTTEYQHQYAWKPSQMSPIITAAAVAKGKENEIPQEPLLAVESKSSSHQLKEMIQKRKGKKIKKQLETRKTLKEKNINNTNPISKPKRVNTLHNGHTLKVTVTEPVEQATHTELVPPLVKDLSSKKPRDHKRTHPLLTEYQSQFNPKDRLLEVLAVRAGDTTKDLVSVNGMRIAIIR